HFRAKVDFADSFAASADTRRASSIFVAHACRQYGLPHFSAAAVARLLEESHREAGDQARESAIFARTEALVMESAAVCRARGPGLVIVADVEAALAAHIARHDYPEQRLREEIAEGDVLIDLHGSKVGQLNGLTQVDLGDYRFGLPVRLSARTYAGEDGLLNIEREVELSGPIHDKGVFILQNYLAGLFAHLAPLSLSASIVFEQQYHEVEGDSASCAELYALLSSLSGLPLRQGIAVTGAVNQHGDVLPVGGINEKIEGYFRVCEAAGLDGSQGVLIPARNRRHLMLEPRVVDAVARGRFHIHAVAHASEGIELLTGIPAGVLNPAVRYPHDSVLGRAQEALLAFRHACRAAEHPPGRRPARAGTPPPRR
ncbi:MAG: AAA family ATPase, partial [Burkholderiaceae bacterium]|nr:AAA family ATPase [Burkholderiaceae bacterium]